MIQIDIPFQAGEFALNAALDAIGAAMLWPQDQIKREELCTYRYLCRKEKIRVDSSIGGGNKALAKGLVSGFILINAIRKSRAGKTFKLSDFKSTFSNIKNFKLSTKTVDNDIWRRFRCVSPLLGILYRIGR